MASFKLKEMFCSQPKHFKRKKLFMIISKLSYIILNASYIYTSQEKLLFRLSSIEVSVMIDVHVNKTDRRPTVAKICR
jgi:hypothetical protein